MHCLNWHIWETPPDIASAQAQTDKCLMGGIVRSDVTSCDKAAIEKQIFNAIEQTKGSRLILTPGCVIRYPINQDMLRFIVDSKTKAEKHFLK